MNYWLAAAHVYLQFNLEKIMTIENVLPEDYAEMLFVLNEVRGQGVGTVLLQHAIKQLAATKVDVNEQNPQAVGFYQHMGFKIESRSPIDDMGKPFPILHMTL
ncbi:GNAT family N-acetyltransferase [Vibrio splendidus]